MKDAQAPASSPCYRQGRAKTGRVGQRACIARPVCRTHSLERTRALIRTQHTMESRHSDGNTGNAATQKCCAAWHSHWQRRQILRFHGGRQLHSMDRHFRKGGTAHPSPRNLGQSFPVRARRRLEMYAVLCRKPEELHCGIRKVCRRSCSPASRPDCAFSKASPGSRPRRACFCHVNVYNIF